MNNIFKVNHSLIEIKREFVRKVVSGSLEIRTKDDLEFQLPWAAEVEYELLKGPFNGSTVLGNPKLIIESIDINNDLIPDQFHLGKCLSLLGNFTFDCRNAVKDYIEEKILNHPRVVRKEE